MELLGDLGQSNLISVCLEMVLASVQDGARFAPNVPYGQKSFWTLPMVLLGDKAQVEPCFGSFEDSANLNAR
jgi:hypothetical protein